MLTDEFVQLISVDRGLSNIEAMEDVRDEHSGSSCDAWVFLKGVNDMEKLKGAVAYFYDSYDTV